MGLKLGKLFKSKPGGTLFGKVLRGVTKLAAGAGVPGAGFVSSLLPEAPPLVLQAAQDAVATAINTPALPLVEVKDVALTAKLAVLAAGGTADQASKIGATAFTAASLAPVDAQKALDVAQTEIRQAGPVNTFGKEDIKTILNGALDGAKSGATDAYLNDTKLGREQKKDAINSAGAKYMPWVTVGATLFAAFMAIRSSRNG